MKSTTDLTDKERVAIVARTNEVSIKQTAEEFEISPDDVINLIYGPALPPAPTSVSTSDPIPVPTSEPTPDSIPVPTLDSNDNDSKLHSDSDKGDNDGDNNNNNDNTDSGPKLRPLRELTDAERMEIIRMSNEIGQPKTAEAFNVSLRTVCYCRNEYAHRKGIDTVKRLKTSPKKEKGNNKGFKNASSTVAAQTAEAIQASEAAETVKAVNVTEVDNIAEAVEATEAVKAIKTSVPSNETEKAVEAATPSGKNMPSAFNKDIVELKIENELLKSEISSLKIQLHKLSSAVMKLI